MGVRVACAILVPVLFSPVLVAASARSDLTFEERVAAQRAIEQVYWSHRIWPKENAAPKPPLSAVLPEAAIRAKVEDYLRASNALDRFWHRPISAANLQAELDRLARDSKDPAMLRELFAALGNDAALIAETLARQTLADRLLRVWYASDARFHVDVKRRAEAALASCGNVGCMKAMGGRYVETTWTRRAGRLDLGAHALDEEAWKDLVRRETRPPLELGPLEETADTFSIGAVLAQQGDSLTVASVVWDKRPFDSWWEAERRALDAILDAPAGAYAVASPATGGCTVDSWADVAHGLDPRTDHTAVWTGTEMIVWGGTGEGGSLGSGGRYTPATDSWVKTSRGANAPMDRFGHSSVWTGTEMIVWGGESGAPGQPRLLHGDGGRYNPATDSWLPIAGGPQARRSHSAVWTGSTMIVWGGVSGGRLTTGGRYFPATDTWLPTSEAGAPSARYFPTAVWTGTEMIIWGGTDGSGAPAFQTGARYNPSTDSWQPTSIGANTPAGVYGHSAVWTGSRMIVWGGTPSIDPVNTGGRYDPASDTWLPTSTGTGTPAARFVHTAIWTGTEMVIWGGQGSNGTDLDTGARYRPDTNSWVTVSKQNASPRSAHTAVWTGTEMIVWGGHAAGINLNSGGRYAPSSNSWVATAVPSVVEPVARTQHSTVWTGTEMIVWGGMIRDSSTIASGGRYSPVTDTWVATPLGGGAPPARYFHSAVWTGTEMIVWGGYDGSGLGYLDSGGRYDPSSNVWHATSRNGSVPSPRIQFGVVWSGTEMIVWGGNEFSGFTNTGARYNPASNSWTPTSLVGAPAPRSDGSAVWTGTEMIVWGGWSHSSPWNAGGRYRPSSDSWAPTSMGVNVPGGRREHSAVWTGTEMIVWGGLADPSDDPVATGGRYDPAGDSWRPTSIAAAPGARATHTAVWTGTEMILWGGVGDTAILNDGGRYNPSSDVWQTTSTAAAPSQRRHHGAVWTGTEMVVWGGSNGGSEIGPSVLGTGGRYCADSCAVPATLYQDLDGDAYGNANVSQVTCAQPPGWAAVSGDCNDGANGTHPGAQEVCDLVDNDCDALVDEAASGVDADGDRIHGACDVCPLVFDPAQSDLDHDGQGDLCDLDDGVIYLAGLDRDHLRWQAESGPDQWNVYEGDLAVLRDTGVYTQSPGSNVLAGRRCGVANVEVDDLTPVPTGAVKFALVTGVAAGIEGSLGNDSQDVERPNTNPCP
jgi:N-acetylneuraminic acid mutarotase